MTYEDAAAAGRAAKRAGRHASGWRAGEGTSGRHRGPPGPRNALHPRQRWRSPCSPSPISPCVVQVSKRWPAAAQPDRTRFPGGQANSGRRTEFDPIRQVHLDTNPRNGLGRRVDHGPGEGLGRGVETRLKTDAAARLLSSLGKSVPNAGLADSSRCSPSDPCSPSCSSPKSCLSAPSPLCRGTGSCSDSRLDTCSGGAGVQWFART